MWARSERSGSPLRDPPLESRMVAPNLMDFHEALVRSCSPPGHLIRPSARPLPQAYLAGRPGLVHA